jgi:hypothetical protein
VLSESWAGTNGAAWPAARWANSSVGSTSVIDIQNNNGRMLPQGAAYTYCRIEPIVGTLTNLEFVASFAMATTGEQYHDVFVRSSGQSTDVSKPHYPANCYAIEVDVLNGLLYYYPIVNSVVGSSVSVVKSWGTGVWTIRIQCIGTTIRVRAWQGAEPTSWDISQTNAQIASGGIRMAAVNGNATTARSIVWDNLTITDSPT